MLKNRIESPLRLGQVCVVVRFLILGLFLLPVFPAWGGPTGWGVSRIAVVDFGVAIENDYAELAQSRRSVAEGNERQRIGNANGNTLTSPGFTTQDIYDPWNRLVRRYQPSPLSGEPAKVIDLYYDADGNRVAKTVWEDTSDFGVPEAFTAYLVDKQSLTGYAQVLEELTAVDPDPFAFSPLSVIRTYAIGHAQISQTQLIDDGTGTPEWTTHFYLYDGQGSVWGLADESGNVTDTYTYEAFGQLIREEGQGIPNAYRYTGEHWDADLGHYYLRARYYEPDRGRFWTMDPFEGFMRDPQSLHKYLYANANPISYIDPSGNMSLASLTLGKVIRTMFLPSMTSATFTGRLIVGALVGTALQFYFTNHYFPNILASLVDLSSVPSLSFRDRLAVDILYEDTVKAYAQQTKSNMLKPVKSQLGLGIFSILTVKAGKDAVDFVSGLNSQINRFVPAANVCPSVDIELAAYNFVLRKAQPERLFYGAADYKRAEARGDKTGMFRAKMEIRHETGKYCK